MGKSTKELTKKDARRVLEVVDRGLSCGLGEPEPGKMCVMAAIQYALGGKHNDRPTCVNGVVREFDISLNDQEDWGSAKARAKGMRREAIAKLGSTGINGRAWLKYVRSEMKKRIWPMLLRKLAKGQSGTQKAELLELARKAADGKAHSLDTLDAVRRVTGYYSDACYAVSHLDMNADRAGIAGRAGIAAGYAACALGNKKPLIEAAKIAEEACIKFKTQGSKWLDILD